MRLNMDRTIQEIIDDIEKSTESTIDSLYDIIKKEKENNNNLYLPYTLSIYNIKDFLGLLKRTNDLLEEKRYIYVEGKDVSL